MEKNGWGCELKRTHSYVVTLVCPLEQPAREPPLPELRKQLCRNRHPPCAPQGNWSDSEKDHREAPALSELLTHRKNFRAFQPFVTRPFKPPSLRIKEVPGTTRKTFGRSLNQKLQDTNLKLLCIKGHYPHSEKATHRMRGNM